MYLHANQYYPCFQRGYQPGKDLKPSPEDNWRAQKTFCSREKVFRSPGKVFWPDWRLYSAQESAVPAIDWTNAGFDSVYGARRHPLDGSSLKTETEDVEETSSLDPVRTDAVFKAAADRVELCVRGSDGPPGGRRLVHFSERQEPRLAFGDRTTIFVSPGCKIDEESKVSLESALKKWEKKLREQGYPEEFRGGFSRRIPRGIPEGEDQRNAGAVTGYSSLPLRLCTPGGP